VIPVVLVWNMIRLPDTSSRLSFIRTNKNNKEFMHLLWLNANSGLAFRTNLNVPKPRPSAPLDSSKEFIKLATKLLKAPFDIGVIKEMEEFVLHKVDPLSSYIYNEILNKRLPVSQTEYNKIIPNGIISEPFELTSKYGVPSFPCVCQVRPTCSVEAIVTMDENGVFLKDKGGCPIGGFDEHLAVFKLMGRHTTYNVLVTDNNVKVYLGNARGDTVKADIRYPILITDMPIASPLNDRLSIIEDSLLSLDGVTAVQLVDSYRVSTLNDTKVLCSMCKDGTHRVIARQNTVPILWVEGTHSIDITNIVCI